MTMNVERSHLVLVGLTGSGKSSVGRGLARKMRRRFLDTDQMVEKESRLTVRQIFGTLGEAEFRRRERDALTAALAVSEPCVIAAAGGVVLSTDNRTALLESSQCGRAIVIWLDTDTDHLLERVKAGGHRPLLDDDPRAVLTKMARDRGDLYEEVADIAIDTTNRSVDGVIDAVLAALAERRIACD